MIDEEKLANAAMSDEELDKVAGGSWVEFTSDMLEAKKRGFAGFENLDFNSDSDLIKMIGDDNLRHQYVEKMGAVFASYGITMEYKGKFSEDNIYTYKGNQITREQAWDIIDGK